MATRFEQTQNIVSRIQQILREYPSGDTILFELLQNADDARAKEVQVLMDLRQVSSQTPSEVISQLGPNHAPTLYFGNSSVFSESDLVNIQNIGGHAEHSKRDDGTKVGRFGIGFNSAFHLSDVIVFVTGRSFIAFDPSRENLPVEMDGSRPGGIRVDFLSGLADLPAELAKFVNQILNEIQETKLFGFRRTEEFHGTIFRFALRRRASAMWREVHSPEKVHDWVLGFQNASRLGMVLLKSVASITASFFPPLTATNPTEVVISPSSSFMAPQLLYKVNRVVTSGLQAATNEILRWLQGYTDCMKALSASAEDPSAVDSLSFMKQLPQPKCIVSEVSVTVNGSGPSSTMSNDGNKSQASSSLFRVFHSFGPGMGWAGSQCWKIAEECARYRHPIAVPWSAAIVEDDGACEGRLLCFFPIRGTTGLPVHLHGYFQLSSDRQSICGVERSPWNSAMGREVVPFSYSRAVQYFCQSQQQAKYNLWPLGTYSDTTVKLFAQSTLACLAKSPTICTPQGFVSAKEAVFALNIDPPTHQLLRYCFAKMATFPEGEKITLESLQLLAKVHAALLAGGQEVGVADSGYYRSELSRSLGSSGGAKLTIPASVGVELFLKCTEDDNLDAFGKHMLKVPIIPMHLGMCASLKNPSDGYPARLLMTPTAQMHDLVSQFPLVDRLVAFSTRQGEENKNIEQSQKGGGEKLSSATPSNNTENENLNAKIAQFRKKLEVLTFVLPPEQITMLSHEALASSMGRSVTWRSPVFVNDDQKINQSNPEKSQSSSTSNWFLLPDRNTPSQRVRCADLYSYLQTVDLNSLQYFTPLHLLPSSSSSHQGAPAAMCPQTDICVVLDPNIVRQPSSSQQANEEDHNIVLAPSISQEQATVDALVRLGAHSIDTSICPMELIAVWAKSGNTMMEVMTETSGHECMMVLDRLIKNKEKRASASQHSSEKLFDLIAHEENASVLSSFIAKTQKNLFVSDCNLLRGLPIFLDLWGHRIKLNQGNVFSLPDQLPLMVLESLRKCQRGSGVLKNCLFLSPADVLGCTICLTAKSTPNLMAEEAAEKEDDKDAADVKDEHHQPQHRHHHHHHHHGKHVKVLGKPPLTQEQSPSTTQLSFVIEPQQFEALLKLLCVEMVDRLTAGCVAALHLPLPLVSPSTEDHHTVNLIWRNLLLAVEQKYNQSQRQRREKQQHSSNWSDIEPLNEGDSTSEEVDGPPHVQLYNRAIKGLRTCKFVPSVVHSDLRTAPSECILPDALSPELYTLIVHIHHACMMPNKVRYWRLPQCPQLPDISFLATNAKETGGSREEINALIKKLQSALVALGMPAKLDGNQLLHTIEEFTQLQNCPSEKLLEFGKTLTEAVEMSNDLKPQILEQIKGLAFIPVTRTVMEIEKDAPVVSTVKHVDPNIELLDDDASEGEGEKRSTAAPSEDTGNAQQREPLPPTCYLAEPNIVRLKGKHDLCPIGQTKPLLQEFLKEQEQYKKGLHQCIRLFEWDRNPTMKDIKNYLNWCFYCPADQSSIVHRIAENMWGTYQYLEDTLEKGLGELPAKDVEELEKIEAFYFPERKMCFELNVLSLNPAARSMEPYLSCVDEVTMVKFPRLIKFFGIPLRHAEQQVAQVISTIGNKATVPLNEETQNALTKSLEYLITVASPEFMAAKGKYLPVPTSDGGINMAANVAYDYFSVQSQVHSPDILHHSVSSHVARAMGMNHTGLRYLQELQPKYSRASRVDGGKAGGGGSSGAGFRARGQHQSLTKAIENILNDYSDFQSIFLEMIQNADDARATEIRFFVDLRNFKADKEGLLGDEMLRCQGPSLVVTNDQMFTMQDFDALMEVGCGHKKKDQLAIGRFGLGFNSVYHLTDCPSIVSGSHVVFLDPTAAHLACASPEAPGLMIDYLQEPQLETHFPHQFKPYGMYGVDFSKMYRGTVIRLPLRREKWERSISPREFQVADIRQMLSEFSHMLHHLPLFLKHICKIEAFEINSKGEIEPLHRVEILNHSEVTEYRENVLSYVAIQHPEKPESPPLLNSCPFHLKLTEGRRTPHSASWLVGTCIQSICTSPAISKKNVDENRRKLVPWSACAFEMDNQGVFMANQQRSLLHCFLPLPIKTGLAFHLHGSFALASNRRCMFMDTLSETESWEIQWNKFILTKLVPKIVIYLLSQHPPLSNPPGNTTASSATTMSQFVSFSDMTRRPHYYNLWPTVNIANPTEVSAVCSPTFFEAVIQSGAKLLWNEGEKRFVKFQEACFLPVGGTPGSMQLPNTNSPQGDSKKNRSNTPPPSAPSSNQPSQLSKRAAQILLNDEALCEIPQAIYEGFTKASEALCVEPPSSLCPEKVANVLTKRAAVSTSYSIPFCVIFPSLPSQTTYVEKVRLLSEISTFALSKHDAEVNHRCPLILLSDQDSLGIIDKDHTAFAHPGSKKDVEVLFSSDVAKCAIDQTFWTMMTKGMTKSQETSVQDRLCVFNVGIENIGKLLSTHAHKYIPESNLGQIMHWDGNMKSSLGQWLANFWKIAKGWTNKIDEEMLKKCGDLRLWPLIPAKREHSIVLVPLEKAPLVAAGNADPIVQDALLHLGIWALDTEFPEARVVRTLCAIADVDSSSIGNLMTTAMKQKRFDTMDEEQRGKLLTWLLSSTQQGMLGRFAGRLFGNANNTDQLKQTIRTLPLFESCSNGKWNYTSAPADALALPRELPVTNICDGYLKAPVTELGITTASLEHFFTKTFFPLISGGGVVSAASYMTVEEELEYLRILGRNPSVLRSVRALLASYSFIPGVRKLPSSFSVGGRLQRPPAPTKRKQNPTNAGVTNNSSLDSAHGWDAMGDAIPDAPTLRGTMINYILNHQLPYQDTLVKHPDLLRRVKKVELNTIDQTVRLSAGEVVRPISIPDVSIPGCMTMCFEVLNDTGKQRTHMLSRILWGDLAIREVLIAAGVKETVPTQHFEQAISAIAYLGTLTRQGVHMKLEALGLDMNDDADVVNQLAISVLQTADKMGDRAAVCEAILDVSFLVGHNAFPNAVGLPYSGKKKGLLLHTPKEVALYQHRHVVGTIQPITDPKFDTILKVPEPSHITVINHIKKICDAQLDPSQTLYPPALVDQCLSESYTYLTMKKRSDVTKDDKVQALSILALPRQKLSQNWTSSETASLQPPPRLVTSFALMIYAPGIGSTAPFFYQARDFDGDMDCKYFVLAFPPKGLPDPGIIFQKISDCALMLKNTSSLEREQHPLFTAHINLLKLLVRAAEQEKISLTDSSAEGNLAEKVKKVSVPTEAGGLWSVRNTTLIDNPALLRRVVPGKLRLLHPSIPHDLAQSLGIPWLSSVLREAGKNVVLLNPHPSSIALQSIQNVSMLQEKWVNFFLRTCTFRRALCRILLTEKQRMGSQQGQQPQRQQTNRGGVIEESLMNLRGGTTTAFSSTSGFPPPVNHQYHKASKDGSNTPSSSILPILQRIHVKIVDTISCTISDSRDEHRENIAASDACPLSALDSATDTIFVCMGALATMKGTSDDDEEEEVEDQQQLGESNPSRRSQQGFLLDPCYLIALEINKLLGGAILNTAPLCQILSSVANGGRFSRVSLQLDHFGCADVCSPGAFGIGFPVKEADYIRFAECPLFPVEPRPLLNLAAISNTAPQSFEGHRQRRNKYNTEEGEEEVTTATTSMMDKNRFAPLSDSLSQKRKLTSAQKRQQAMQEDLEQQEEGGNSRHVVVVLNSFGFPVWESMEHVVDKSKIMFMPRSLTPHDSS